MKAMPPCIVVVDGDPDILAVLRMALEELGSYSVRCARNISDAMIYGDTMRPDLAIVDVVMPNGTGLELVNAIDVPVLLMTGHPDVADRLEARGRTILRKPFRLQTLLDRAKEALERRSAG